MEEKYLEYLLKINGVEAFKETDTEVMFNFDEESTSHISALRAKTLLPHRKLKRATEQS